MSEKSILEQALLQVQTLEEAVKANAKGILASTMKQELNDLLKESMEDEEEVKSEEEMTEPKEEEEKDMPEQSEEDDETGDEEDLDNEDEPSKDIEGMDSDMEDEMNSDMEDEMNSDMEDEMDTEMEDMGSEMEDEEDVLDMTGASDEEILKVFKSMKPEDGVIVKKDGEDISMSNGDDEFIIKLDEEEEESHMEEESDMKEEEETHMDEGSEMEEDETIYEIELDDEDMNEEEEEEAHEGDMEEAARTKWNPHGDKGGMDRAGIKSKKIFKAGSSINEEVETLKKQNNEYKKALVLFKEKLNEVAVFNANLAYATQIFTEHSTTRQEKLNILKRFDSISTLKESKNLYKTIKTELETKKPVTESVVEKITSTPKSSASEKVLSESKAYENPQFKRMKDLMSKIK